ncbi:MAG: FAD-dependent oxidoreductase [Chitinophagaceae bacterium]|nr:MAG: FAD-dependent oxidoreductase [Chitinophagaceae bacterium]
MRRRNFLRSIAISSGVLASAPIVKATDLRNILPNDELLPLKNRSFSADLIIGGGGLGGCAAALAALRNGLWVIMTEETDWIGGQLTQQGLSCPDENPWIETIGGTRSYRDLRTAIREYYRNHYPLTTQAKSNQYLNPGNGSVSRLCHEPRVALAILMELMNPYLSSGRLILLLQHKIIAADVDGDQIRSVKAQDLKTGEERILSAPYFIDATELGDLLPLTGTEFVTGAESKKQTKELHAAEKADPGNQQAFTLCFAMDYLPGTNNIIDKPKEYTFWKNYIPQLTPPWSGKLLDLKYISPRNLKPKALGFNPAGAPADDMLNLWNYRRIIDQANFKSGFYLGGITIVNWPQNDFLLGNLVGLNGKEYKKTIERAEQLDLSLFYWLQTEVPHADGKSGWPGLRLRGDIMGTETGLAKYPYVRESRRINAVFTVLEEHVGIENRNLVTGKKEGNHAAFFYDSVGIGSYSIDLHPTSAGNNYIDIGTYPFQIPLGALLPVRMQNLIPACLNIGTTHITNGCYRLHPIEWNIGESAGMLVAYSLRNKIALHGVRASPDKLKDFQDFIRSQGIATQWPKDIVSY